MTNVYAVVTERTNHYENTIEKNRWLRVSAIGKPDAGIKNFKIVKVDTYERGTYSTFKYPLSDKLVPFIWKDDLDKVAEAILNKYDRNALLTPTRVEPDYIVQQMGLQLKYASITEDTSIFGQIYFQDNPEKGISAGTVVIDEKLPQIRNLGVVRNTILHECVHWELHRYALELARAEKEEFSVLSTTNDIKDEKASDMIGWMEWHAESIAPKILMPKEMFIQEARSRQQRLLELSQTQDILDILEKWIDEKSFELHQHTLHYAILCELKDKFVKKTIIKKYWIEDYVEDNEVVLTR